MFRSVYLTATILSSEDVRTLEHLGYEVRPHNGGHVIGYRWLEGHWCVGLQENPKFLRHEGRFVVEYTPEPGERGFCYARDGDQVTLLRGSGPYYGPEICHVIVTGVSAEVTVYDVKIFPRSREPAKGFEAEAARPIRTIRVEKKPPPVALQQPRQRRRLCQAC